MDILRVDGYHDGRFSPKVLFQHGAYLCDGAPYALEIVGRDTAVVRGGVPSAELLEAFRFHAGHITRFVSDSGEVLAQFPEVERFCVAIAALSPTQTSVSQEKLEAVSRFVHSARDLMIPLMKIDGCFAVLDGHSRLCAALRKGIHTAYGYWAEDIDVEDMRFFLRAARGQGIRTPADIPVLSAAEHARRWDGFCDAYFAKKEGMR